MSDHHGVIALFYRDKFMTKFKKIVSPVFGLE